MSEGPKSRRKGARTGGSRFHIGNKVDAVEKHVHSLVGALADLRENFFVRINGELKPVPDVVSSHETRITWIEDNAFEKRGRPSSKKRRKK